MYYFLAIFKENETDIKIITEKKVIDDKNVSCQVIITLNL